MNNNDKNNRDAEAYAARVIAGVSSLPASEIIAADAADKINTKDEAARVRSMLLKTAAAHGQSRLKNAQDAVADGERQSFDQGAKILTFEAKQAKLRRLLAANPTLTQAARQGRGMDEDEIDDYLADLAELGITETDDN